MFWYYSINLSWFSYQHLVVVAKGFQGLRGNILRANWRISGKLKSKLNQSGEFKWGSVDRNKTTK